MCPNTKINEGFTHLTFMSRYESSKLKIRKGSELMYITDQQRLIDISRTFHAISRE